MRSYLDRMITSEWFAYRVLKAKVWRILPWPIRVWRWRVYEGCVEREWVRRHVWVYGKGWMEKGE
jgi:hypothetical protein